MTNETFDSEDMATEEAENAIANVAITQPAAPSPERTSPLPASPIVDFEAGREEPWGAGLYDGDSYIRRPYMPRTVYWAPPTTGQTAERLDHADDLLVYAIETALMKTRPNAPPTTDDLSALTALLTSTGAVRDAVSDSLWGGFPRTVWRHSREFYTVLATLRSAVQKQASAFASKHLSAADATNIIIAFAVRELHAYGILTFPAPLYTVVIDPFATKPVDASRIKRRYGRERPDGNQATHIPSMSEVLKLGTIQLVRELVLKGREPVSDSPTLPVDAYFISLRAEMVRIARGLSQIARAESIAKQTAREAAYAIRYDLPAGVSVAPYVRFMDTANMLINSPRKVVRPQQPTGVSDLLAPLGDSILDAAARSPYLMHEDVSAFASYFSRRRMRVPSSLNYAPVIVMRHFSEAPNVLSPIVGAAVPKDKISTFFRLTDQPIDNIASLPDSFILPLDVLAPAYDFKRSMAAVVTTLSDAEMELLAQAVCIHVDLRMNAANPLDADARLLYTFKADTNSPQTIALMGEEISGLGRTTGAHIAVAYSDSTALSGSRPLPVIRTFAELVADEKTAVDVMDRAPADLAALLSGDAAHAITLTHNGQTYSGHFTLNIAVGYPPAYPTLYTKSGIASAHAYQMEQLLLGTAALLARNDALFQASRLTAIIYDDTTGKAEPTVERLVSATAVAGSPTAQEHEFHFKGLQDEMKAIWLETMKARALERIAEQAVTDFHTGRYPVDLATASKYVALRTTAFIRLTEALERPMLAAAIDLMTNTRVNNWLSARVLRTRT